MRRLFSFLFKTASRILSPVLVHARTGYTKVDSTIRKGHALLMEHSWAEVLIRFVLAGLIFLNWYLGWLFPMVVFESIFGNIGTLFGSYQFAHTVPPAMMISAILLFLPWTRTVGLRICLVAQGLLAAVFAFLMLSCFFGFGDPGSRFHLFLLPWSRFLFHTGIFLGLLFVKDATIEEGNTPRWFPVTTIARAVAAFVVILAIGYCFPHPKFRHSYETTLAREQAMKREYENWKHPNFPLRHTTLAKLRALERTLPNNIIWFDATTENRPTLSAAFKVTEQTPTKDLLDMVSSRMSHQKIIAVYKGPEVAKKLRDAGFIVWMVDDTPDMSYAELVAACTKENIPVTPPKVIVAKQPPAKP